LSCEVVISTIPHLQSSKHPEWLAVDPWKRSVHAALSYTARGFVAR
jgi:hypothetical protein